VVRLGSGGSINPTAVANCTPARLDRSLVLQFFDFIAGFARGRFRHVDVVGKPVSQEIATRIPVSLEIALLATLVAVLIAIPLGTISALHQNSWLDHIVRTVAIAGIATPSFWLGIMSILVVLEVSHLAFAPPGCRRSTMSRCGTIRCATCRS